MAAYGGLRHGGRTPKEPMLDVLAPGFPDSWIPRFPDSRIPEFLAESFEGAGYWARGMLDSGWSGCWGQVDVRWWMVNDEW